MFINFERRILTFCIIVCSVFTVISANTKYLDGRIIKGNLSKPNEFPYVVRILVYRVNGERTYCTGTLIAVNWVLTAAHCLVNVNFTQIIFGNVVKYQQKPINASWQNFKIHKGFTESKGLLSDIGLIQIPKVTLSDSVQVIKLPRIMNRNPAYNGKKVIAAGWGKSNDEHRDVLHYADMRVMSREACDKYHDSERKQICIISKGSASCFGDSGGPLILKTDDNDPIQIGVMSATLVPGCQITKPSICTRVSRYTRWIKKITGIPL